MSRRPLVALAGVALAGSVLVAAPAEAATYGVTLDLSKVKADVGQKIGLSGKVTGSKSAKKKLSVQYRLGNGTWKTVKTVTTSSKATYATTFTVKTAGDAGLRVVAPKSGSTKAGTSPTKTFAGYRWLWLTQQSHYVAGAMFIDSPNMVEGKDRPRTIDLGSEGSSASITWNLQEKCDTSDITVALNDQQNPASEQVYYETNDGGATVTATNGARTPANGVSSSSEYLTFRRGSTTRDVLMVSPRVHCKVNELPRVSF
ncbi:MAG: hypothetical protein PGN07_07700 [Aeromicrobium erythreum]